MFCANKYVSQSQSNDTLNYNVISTIYYGFILQQKQNKEQFYIGYPFISLILNLGRVTWNKTWPVIWTAQQIRNHVTLWKLFYIMSTSFALSSERQATTTLAPRKANHLAVSYPIPVIINKQIKDDPFPYDKHELSRRFTFVPNEVTLGV